MDSSYLRKAQSKYASRVGKLEPVDLTREFCEIAIEENPELVRGAEVDKLIDWVIEKSGNNNRFDIKQALLDEFEAMAFTYHSE